MGLTEIILLAVGLSMDAFAVSVCKGLAISKIDFKKAAICGIWFGGFQALMPMIGYLLGAGFTGYITGITPWIAFVLLSLIGGNMIKETDLVNCVTGSMKGHIKNIASLDDLISGINSNAISRDDKRP